MVSDIAKELLDELVPHLETLETQCAGVLQFLKDKGIATDKELAPYLEEAGKASDVRWRAARLRIERLLSSLTKATDKVSEVPAAQPKLREGGGEEDSTQAPAEAKHAGVDDKKAVENDGAPSEATRERTTQDSEEKVDQVAQSSEQEATDPRTGSDNKKKASKPDEKPEKDAA